MKKQPKDLTRPPYKLSPRSKLERWLDRHNHKMEFLRTFFGFLTIGLQIVILLKIFNFI